MFWDDVRRDLACLFADKEKQSVSLDAGLKSEIHDIDSELMLKPVFLYTICGQNLFSACCTHRLLVVSLRWNAHLRYSCTERLQLR